MAAKPYDPINSIEGMFNGCITRIAQAVKDPANFGPSTKGVLLECSKRFQDALDDCEVQVLEAKFYLEHQLALNKAKREAKAREEGAATAKRKHDEIKDAGEQPDNAKRVKLDDNKSTEPEKSDKPAQPTQAPEPSKPEAKPSEKPQQPTPTPKPAEPSKPSPPKAPDKPAPKSPDKPPEEPTTQTPAIDDFPKPTPNATPAPTNNDDDFNFESMFGEPSADGGVGVTGNNDANDIFDLNLGDDFTSALEGTNDPDSTNLNPADQDLNSLLPGLESYANAAPDDSGGLGSSLPELPDLGPNDFDAFLDANDFTADGSMNLTNLNPDDPMNNLDNMDNMDFDSMFS